MVKRKKGIKKRRASPEHALQASYVEWMHLQYPYIIVYATPNGAKRSPQYAAYLRAEGLLSGVADITVLYPNDRHHLLFIEFKYGKNKTSPTQAAFLAYASSYNYRSEVCYSLEEAMAVTKDHMRDYHA